MIPMPDRLALKLLIGVGCVPRVLRSFLEAPTPAQLDASCLDLEPPTPFFLTLLGPAP